MAINLCPEGVGSIVRGACGNKPVSGGGREHCPGGGGGGGGGGACANKLVSRGGREYCLEVIDQC